MPVSILCKLEVCKLCICVYEKVALFLHNMILMNLHCDFYILLSTMFSLLSIVIFEVDIVTYAVG